MTEPTEAEVITRTNPTCNFCSKSNTSVRRLIAGPTANICDGCVLECVEIIVRWADDLKFPNRSAS